MILYVIVIDVTKHDRGVTNIIVTVALSYDIKEKYKRF